MPSLGMMLVIWGLAAPVVTFGWMKSEMWVHDLAAASRQKKAVADAVKATQTDEKQQCAGRIDSIAKELNDDAKKQVEQARQAAAAVVLAPSDDPGLRILCQRSASCRDRQPR